MDVAVRLLDQPQVLESTPMESGTDARRLTFFDFPRSVRERVYEYASISGNVIDFNFSNLEVTEWSRKFKYYATSSVGYRLDTKVPTVRRLNPAATDKGVKRSDAETNAENHSRWQLMDRQYNSAEFFYPVYCLLFVTRRLHDEVKPIIFRQNSFRICMGNPNGVQNLCNLRDPTLALLTSLSIRLTIPEHLRPHPATSVGWHHTDYLSLDPLDPPEGHVSTTLRFWKDFVEKLARVMAPEQLELYLSFSSTPENVTAILEPMGQLPRLKNTGIFWLPHRPTEDATATEQDDAEFASIRLINQTIHQLTKHCEQKTPVFRFLDLPKEIRAQILEYALVQKDDVQWRPRNKEPPQYTYCKCPDNMDITDDDSIVVDKNGNCLCASTIQTCPADVEVSASNCRPGAVPCCGTCGPHAATSCYCPWRGYKRSTSCKCQTGLPPLFAVNRQIREEAKWIYYFRNRFIVTPYNSPKMHPPPDCPWMDAVRWTNLESRANCPWPPRGFHNAPRVELSLYISSLGRTALRNITWLEWVVPNCRPSYLLPPSWDDSPAVGAWQDYLDTLELMRCAMNLPNLTLVYNLASTSYWVSKAEKIFWEESSRDEPVKRSWQWSEEIVKPVRRLGEAGLKDFFVYIRPHGPEAERIAYERKLERSVMGEKYDSGEREKPRERFQDLGMLSKNEWIHACMENADDYLWDWYHRWG